MTQCSCVHTGAAWDKSPATTHKLVHGRCGTNRSPIKCAIKYEPLHLQPSTIHNPKPVADPGFTRGGGDNCKGGGSNLLFWSTFQKKKLHENEKISNWGAGVHPLRHPAPRMKTITKLYVSPVTPK